MSPLIKRETLGGRREDVEKGGKGDVVLTEVESDLTVYGLLPFHWEIVGIGVGVGVGE